MKRNILYHKLLKSISIFALILIVYHLAIRPSMLEWGAPSKIQNLALSGDYLTGGRMRTRSVLIHATPQKVWPWIVQLGQERGGFYSYTWLENIFQADMHNVYELRYELQYPRISGDTVWLAAKENYKGKGFQILAQLIPDSSFVMVSGEDYERIQNHKKAMGSWGIYLYPENAESTWLIARSSGGDESLGVRVLRYFTFEIPHFIMEQKMLRTIRSLVEDD